MLPSDSIWPSAFAAGMPRKVAKNRHVCHAHLAQAQLELDGARLEFEDETEATKPLLEERHVAHHEQEQLGLRQLRERHLRAALLRNIRWNIRWSIRWNIRWSIRWNIR